MLGDLDDIVKEYIKQLRTTGGVISTAVVMAAARGIILSKNQALLQEYGGSTSVVMAAARGIILSKNQALLHEYGGYIAIEKSWASSMLIRMNFVKYKGTNSANLPPSDFEKVKNDFLERVKTVVLQNQIVPQMVINWNQTAVRLVPYSDWTMEEQGSNKISIKRRIDKRDITALLSITLLGNILPPQLLYTGKTERCHPDFNFHSDCDIWCTENHWSIKSTVLQYIDTILNPYLTSKRQDLELADTHKPLLIMDIFKAH